MKRETKEELFAVFLAAIAGFIVGSVTFLVGTLIIKTWGDTVGMIYFILVFVASILLAIRNMIK
jgi:hypothetical protein